MKDEEGPLTPRALDIEDMSVRKPWERQVGEGDKEWTAFKAYRDMNPRDVKRSGFIGGIRVSSSELSEWYRVWNWAARVEAYDLLTDRIVAAQRKKRLEESVDDVMADQLGALSKVLQLCDLEAGKLVEASAETQGPGLVKPADLKGLLEAAIKMYRLVKGETTERIEVASDAKVMPIEEVRAWHARLKELKRLKAEGNGSGNGSN